jgi:hypothetical protein
MVRSFFAAGSAYLTRLLPSYPEPCAIPNSWLSFWRTNRFRFAGAFAAMKVFPPLAWRCSSGQHDQYRRRGLPMVQQTRGPHLFGPVIKACPPLFSRPRPFAIMSFEFKSFCPLVDKDARPLSGRICLAFCCPILFLLDADFAVISQVETTMPSKQARRRERGLPPSVTIMKCPWTGTLQRQERRGPP